MVELTDIRQWGEIIVNKLALKSRPIGLKFLSHESEIPAGSMRPKKDKGQHLAQCQAFALARRQGLTVAMTIEDHWCWGALIGYGLADHRAALELPATRRQAEIMPRLETGKYVGLVCGPLDKINFLPDVALIYSNTAQLRIMLMVLSFNDRQLVNSVFDPIDSCVYSVVPTFQEGKIRITLPDPGESDRATAQDDEIILSLPVEKIPIMAEGLTRFKPYMTPTQAAVETNMIPDFPRPEFYRQLFQKWGLEQ